MALKERYTAKRPPAPAPEPEPAAPHLIGYARVSTRDQDPQMQIDALIAAGVAEKDIYYEKVSGAASRRPELAALKKDAREGDIVVFWKLDRLGRSVRQVLETIAELDARGARIRCLTQPIDTTTPVGRLILTVLAAVSEMERELGRERTMAGLASARARGRVGGKKPTHTDDAILEFAKRGTKPGARAAKMSVQGFIKARQRALDNIMKEKRSDKRKG